MILTLFFVALTHNQTFGSLPDQEVECCVLFSIYRKVKIQSAQNTNVSALALPLRPSFSCIDMHVAHAPHFRQPASPRPHAQLLENATKKNVKTLFGCNRICKLTYAPGIRCSNAMFCVETQEILYPVHSRQKAQT